jgi:hypothetical protein
MRFAHASVLCGGSAWFLVSACTVLLDTPSLTGGSRGGAGGQAGGAAGAQANGGTAGVETDAGGSTSVGGAGGTSGVAGGVSAAGEAGDDGASAGAAGSSSTCVPSSDPTEYCDGIDNDCDPSTPDVCPSDCVGHAFQGVGYMACSDGHTWDASEARCMAQGMHVVKVDTAPENAFVLSLVRTLGPWVWIGASDEAKSGTFKWIHGSTIIVDGAPVAGVYQNFASGQPTTLAAASCLQMNDGSVETAGAWSNTACTGGNPYICEEY